MSRTRVLSVAEKPSVAKELASIIAKNGDRTLDVVRRQGFSTYNPIFEIENSYFRSQVVTNVITSVSGHMMEIEFQGNFKNWNGCSPIDLFVAPLTKQVKKESVDISKTLVAEARKADILFLWLDCDLEGENIAFEVIQVCKEANPRLDVYRARFSALIPRDIFRTVRNPDRPNSHMNDAVEARQEIDLRIGAAFTRFQTLRLQRRFENIGSVISYGPCQFPTLGFVVERDLAIKSFQPCNFWYISCEVDFPDPDKSGSYCTLTFNWDRGRLYDRFACLILYESCLDDNALATVVGYNQRPTVKFRPFPLNTIEFQMLASRFLRMSSSKAMAVAEALYQRGILSYPRTETNFFKEGFELLPLLEDHRGHSTWGAYISKVLDNQHFEWPRRGNKDDQAHPPIHPTKSIDLQTLENDDERQVYELVCRHFLACCSRDAKGSKTSITINIPQGGESFSATGLVVLEKNWLEVYRYESWNGVKAPALSLGQTLRVKNLVMKEGKTAPPEPISEADLIATMDRNGIGTDATIAQHIATIQTREYVVKDASNRFSATKLGLALVEGYNNMGYQLNRPELRAMIEADCQRVAKGEKTKDAVIQSCLQTMKKCFETCQREATKLDQAMEKYFKALGSLDSNNYNVLHANLATCGVCHEGMELRAEKPSAANEQSRRFLYCENCKKSLILPSRGEFIEHELSCAICGYQVITVRNPDTNKDHTICPYCFSHPPAPPVGQDGVQDFRCFSCAMEGCPLASRQIGADIDIASCSQSRCNGFYRLKKTSKGFVISCSIIGCSAPSWWAPRFVRSVAPKADEVCRSCQDKYATRVIKLQFRFNLSVAPRGLEPEQTICAVCDPLWSSIGHNPLQIKRSVFPPNAQQHGISNSNNLLEQSNRFNSRSNHGNVSTSKALESNDNAPNCDCGIPCKLKVTRKEGENKGRPFYSCDSGNCRFFSWADAVHDSGGSREIDKGNRKARDDVICLKCKESGHYAKSCPTIGKQLDNNVCARCKQPGHWARACPLK